MLKGWQLAYTVARAAWPQLDLSIEQFERYLAEFSPPITDTALVEQAADIYFACACALDISGSTEQFEKHVLPPGRRAIEQISAQPAFVSHCLEVLRYRLFAKGALAPLLDSAPTNQEIRRFRGQDTLQRWVCVVATGTALREQQKRTPEGRPRELSYSYLLAGTDHELAALHAELLQSGISSDGIGEALSGAVREALEQLSPHERNVLRMHLAGDCSIDQIGRAYGVHRATAARWLSDARHAVDQHVMRSLAPDRTLGKSLRLGAARRTPSYDSSRNPISSSQGSGPGGQV